MNLLHERGIQARPFHPSLADSPHVKAQGQFPNAQSYAATGLTLPSGPDQSEENLVRTVKALRAISADIQTEIESCPPLCWVP